VQGVGFRYWALKQALQLCLNGSAANLPDGSVEIVVCGTVQGVEKMVLLCGTGPRHARVETLIELDRQQTAVCPEGFRILQ
jgi:acylphosphatase